MLRLTCWYWFNTLAAWLDKVGLPCHNALHASWSWELRGLLACARAGAFLVLHPRVLPFAWSQGAGQLHILCNLCNAGWSWSWSWSCCWWWWLGVSREGGDLGWWIGVKLGRELEAKSLLLALMLELVEQQLCRQWEGAGLASGTRSSGADKRCVATPQCRTAAGQQRGHRGVLMQSSSSQPHDLNNPGWPFDNTPRTCSPPQHETHYYNKKSR